MAYIFILKNSVNSQLFMSYKTPYFKINECGNIPTLKIRCYIKNISFVLTKDESKPTPI